MNKYQEAINYLKEETTFFFFDNDKEKHLTNLETLQELINNVNDKSSIKEKDKEFIDQLHYAHEHLYACQGDFYSNGSTLTEYHIEKLETAKAIIDNSLAYIKERIK